MFGILPPLLQQEDKRQEGRKEEEEEFQAWGDVKGRPLKYHSSPPGLVFSSDALREFVIRQEVEEIHVVFPRIIHFGETLIFPSVYFSLRSGEEFYAGVLQVLEAPFLSLMRF